MLGKKDHINSAFSFVFYVCFFFFLAFHIRLPSETATFFEKVSSYAVILGVA